MRTARRAVATLAGAGALASSMGGTLVALAPAAAAAPAPGQDVNNDWGQSAADVTDEVTAAVEADPRVVAARARYAIALSRYASIKTVEGVAYKAYRSALATRSKTDDVATSKRLKSIRAQVMVAAREVVVSQLNQVHVVDAVTAQVRSHHYVQAPYVALPGQPTGLTASGSTGQVSLSWTAASDATSYRVFRDGIQVGTAVSPGYVDSGLVDGTTYTYTVMAVNVAGWSPVSAPVDAVPSVSAPAAPTNLTAAPGDGTVQLAWSASAGATSYKVYRGPTLVQTLSATTWTDSGLANGTSYSYTVVAYNGVVASPASTAVSCTPVAAAPAAPTGLVANAGNNQVSLTWNATVGATGYQVRRNNVAIGGLLTTTSYVDTTAVNGQTYSYTVVAYRQNSPASAASTAVSASPVAPALSAPSGLAATPGDKTVALSWNAVPSATLYTIYRDGASVGTSTTTAFTDTGLVNGTTYSYYVVASNATSTSAPSAATTAKPAAAVAGAPTNLSGQAGDTIATLSWTGVAGITQYKVYRGGVYVTTVNGTTYTDTGLTNGGSYSYYVTAYNGTTESAPSTTVTVVPVAITPGVPTGVVATPGNTQVSLSWTASANAQSYKVYRGATLVGSPTTTSFVDTGLVNGTSYTYTVVAVNGTASSAASAGVSATPLAPAPGAATLVGTAGNNQVTLTWGAVPTATSYRVYRGAALLASPTTTSYTDTTAVNGTAYTYTVVAVNQTTPGPSSNAVTVTPTKPPVNGTFTGTATTIQGNHGKITVVIVVSNSVISTSTGTLTSPDGNTTMSINNNALPQYNSKAVVAQGTNFTKVSGATYTYNAYRTSLQAALTAAGL